MDGTQKKACIFGGFILIAYGIYTIANPTTDGYIFATVVGALAAIGGYVIRNQTPGSQ